MVKYVIFGSTGPSGVLLVRELLANIPTASLVLYVRNTSKLPSDIAKNPAITVAEGQLDEEDKISNILSGADAVVSALGPPSSGGHPADLPITRFYKALVPSLRQHNVKRLILLGTASMVAPEDKFSFPFFLTVKFVKTFIHNAYIDLVASAKYLKTVEDIDWTIVRVPFLNDKPNKEVVAGFLGDGKVGTTLARAGFAAFTVQELQHPQYVRKLVAISSK